MRWLVFAVMMALAACDTTTLAGGDPGPQVSRQQADENFSSAVSRIKPVAERLCQDRRAVQNCDFRFVIDDTPGRAPNAFQSLGVDGRPVLTFTVSLIADARNRDEIALIIAHEAAHHIEGHLGRLNQEVAKQRALSAASADQAEAGAGVSMHAKVHAFELAADALGAQIALAAGFDPRIAMQIYRRLPMPAGGHSRTHPAKAERLQAVRQAMQAPL